MAGGGAGVSDGEVRRREKSGGKLTLSTIHASLQHLDRWIREHH